MRLSPRARRTLLRIVPFGVIWFLFAQVFLISDYAAAGGVADLPDTAITVDPGIYVFAILAVTVLGLLVGAVELLFLNRRLAPYSLTAKLIVKTACYVALLGGVILLTYPIAAAMEMDVAPTDPRVWRRLGDFLWSPTSLGTVTQLTTSLVASLFYAEISEHMGPHVLTNFLTGRYHTPKEERRIFLFSDMKSSTTLAERLGHATYFELLRAYYAALSDAIVDHGGEIYEYVGDEVIVSWPEEVGLRDADCLRCVARMKRDLRRAGPAFERRFGVAPDFRAALQAGAVTTGEIGALKKEIVFTGDVLNQTARIQALGRELDEDVLVGGALQKRLGTEGRGWRLRPLGDRRLRGKHESVALWAADV